MSAPTSKKRGKVSRRTASRLAAVQALFQWSKSEDPIGLVEMQFRRDRLGKEIDDVKQAKADADFFADLINGTSKRVDEIDGMIEEALASGWTMARLDSLVLQILRAGTYELIARPDIPTAVIIAEYVDLTNAFYDEGERNFVNGLLDRLAKELKR